MTQLKSTLRIRLSSEMTSEGEYQRKINKKMDEEIKEMEEEIDKNKEELKK